MDPRSDPIGLDSFLRELGLAWQRLSMYQPGHPARRDVVERARDQLAVLAASRGELAVGVDREGLVGTEETIGGGPIRALAESLYKRGVAVVRFEEGTRVEDLEALLETIPRSRPTDDEPPLWEVLTGRGVSRVRLEPVDFAFVEPGREGEEEAREEGAAAEEEAPLWESLLRALVSPGSPDGAGDAPEVAEILAGAPEEEVEAALRRAHLELERRGAAGRGRLVLEVPRVAAGQAEEPVPSDQGEAASRLETLAPEHQLAALGTTLLDLLERPFLKAAARERVAARLGEVFRALLAEGRLKEAVALVERLRAMEREGGAGEEGAEVGLAELRRPVSVATLLERPAALPLSAAERILQLVDLLGPGVLDALLEAMCEEQDLSNRRKTFDLMASLGPPLVPRARALMSDDRWYVRRNMLSLLRRLPGGLNAETVVRGFESDDPRVRTEAARAMADVEVPDAVVARAVTDPDPKVAEAAVGVVGSRRLAAGVEPLLALLEPLDPLGRHRELRLRALEALGKIGDPRALDALTPFFNPVLSPVSGEERRAAYRSLAGYPVASREPWLRKGRWCADQEVRAICRQLVSGGAAG